MNGPEGVKKVYPRRQLPLKGVEMTPLGSYVFRDQSSAQTRTEAALLQGLCRPVLCLPPVLIPLVSCPWRWEHMCMQEVK